MCSQLNILSNSVLILLLIFKLFQCSFNTFLIVLDELNFTSFNTFQFAFLDFSLLLSVFPFQGKDQGEGTQETSRAFYLTFLTGYFFNLFYVFNQFFFCKW